MKIFNILPIWIAGFYISCSPVTPETIQGNFAIAPLPATLQPGDGKYLIDRNTWIKTDSFNADAFDPLKIFQEVFERKSGYSLPVYSGNGVPVDARRIIMIMRSPIRENDEGYRLSIRSEGILISSATEQGVFYALQTLRQIMRLDAVPDAGDSERRWSVPIADIIDYPSFSYRGLHLDVCRHFMPIDFVKKYIDLMAYYKFNRFHWHLTEDQGWRIDIKKYPRLREVSAWRDATLIGRPRDENVQYDSTRHGGYYTQEEIKEVVAFAADRGITIIPEIEMPGHALAALAAYPELGCTKGPYNVVGTWGVFDDVFCAGREETFTFLQGVLDEVLECFPSPYIHIGGDECPKTRWKACPDCQHRMKTEGLRDEHELQSYFVQRMEKYLNEKGRTIIGWDEILEGGLAPNATVMSWRGKDGAIAAAQAGHQAIMTPVSHCYFDYYQDDPASQPLSIGGLITLEKVYSFDPIPSELTAEEARFILGGQANLWTEYIPTTAHAEYMAYPRAIAMAEVLWTPREQRSWESFTERLARHVDRLEGLGVHYAKKLK